MNPRVRGLLAVTLTAAVVTLPACSKDKKAEPAQQAIPSATASAPATPAPSASPTPSQAPAKVANNLDEIKVDGEPNTLSKVSVPAPWAIDETRSKVLSPGSGATVSGDSTVEVNYYGVNGRTGQRFDDSFSRGQTAYFPLDQVVPGFKKGLSNQKVGSRVLMAMPGKDGYDQMGGNQQADIQVGDTLIFVVDILSTPLSQPEGDPVAPKAGLPTVSGGPAETPKVTLPGTPPPAQLVTQPLIQGKGKKVGQTDTITVNYQTVAWSNGQVVDQSYGQKPQSGPLAKLVPGWQEGLVNQQVGSRMLLVVPPDKAYPQGNETPKINPGETLVFVVDILFAEPSQ